jgi:hypothetical protein
VFLFDHLWAILLFAAQVAICLGVVVGLVYGGRSWLRRRLPPGPWRAGVFPAQKGGYDYYKSSYSTDPVRGEVAVRLTRSSQVLTIATLKVEDEGFEEKLTAAVASAEERANALNAAEEILR